MLTVVRDAQGRILAACDWWLVDAQGAWTPQGLYVYLHQFERSPGVNLHQVRRVLVREIGALVPHAVGVYWTRDHDRFPRPHAFRREQLREEVGV